MADDRLELRPVTFGEIRGDPGLAGALGITPAHLRSLAGHPYALSDEVAFLLMERDGTRVARFGLLPGLLRVGDRLLRVNWGSEFDYDGDPRHRPYAGLLFLRALERAGSYCGAGPSALFRPLLDAAGLRFVAVDRYVAVMHGAPYVRRISRPLAGLAAPALDLALGAERRIRGMGTTPLELVAVQRFDRQVAELERHRGRCSFYRDDAELNWVLSGPWVASDYRYAAFSVRERTEPVGFALVRIRRIGDHVVATIVRTALGPGHSGRYGRLLAALLRRLADADVVDLYTNQGHVANAARALGMRRRGKLEITARFSADAQGALSAAACTLAEMPLEFGEGDVIFA